MINLTTEEWRQVHDEVDGLRNSFLWEVIQTTLEKDRETLLTALDSVKTPENVTNYARGGRYHLKCAIMVLDKLKASAVRHLDKSRPPEDDE